DRAAKVGGELAAAVLGVTQRLIHQLSRRQPILKLVDGLLQPMTLLVNLALEFGRVLVAIVAVHQNFSFTTSASCASEWVVRLSIRLLAFSADRPLLISIQAMMPTTTATMAAARLLAAVGCMSMPTKTAARAVTSAASTTPRAPRPSTAPNSSETEAPTTWSTFSDASVLASWISLRNNPVTSETRPPRRSGTERP